MVIHVLIKSIRVGSKLEIEHPTHGRIPALVTRIENGKVYIDRYLQKEHRWMANGPVELKMEQFRRIVRR